MRVQLLRSLVAFLVCTAFVAGVVASDNYETNDTQETATLLIVGGEDLQSHTLNPKGDVDWFRFYGREDEIYDIFTADIGDSVDLVIEIYDSNGQLVREAIDDTFLGEPETFSFRAPSTAQFFLKVFNYCDSESDGNCVAGTSDDYSIYIFVPIGAAGGTDLAVVNSFSGDPQVGAAFPVTVTATNNGGQQEDNTGTNLLIMTYTEPPQPVPAALPEGCDGQPGYIQCALAELAVDASVDYEFSFVFEQEGNVRISSAVAGFSNTDYDLQQPDDALANNIAENVLAIAASSGGNDTDNDGVLDPADNCPAVANANQTDTDNDDEGDACDTDDDGDDIADSADNCPLTSNTNQTNTDDDTEGDACDADDDNDEVLDGADNCPLISNADQADADSDGKGDACDSSDDSDTDNDGIGDLLDNCPAVANSDQANNDNDASGDACDTDDDNDAVLDSADNCPLIANAGQANNDDDASGDACDTDDDNDAVLDSVDNCPLIANAGQVNNDEDASGDACDTDDDNDAVLDDADNCPLISNPDQADEDLDGDGDACDADIDNDQVVNDADNCPFDPNTDQADLDKDNTGDACDADIDGDAVLNGDDNCKLIANADQADEDEDGLGDACDENSALDSDEDGINDDLDNCPNDANADQADADNDGVGDVCDTSPNDADDDGIDDEVDNCPLVDNSDQLDFDDDGVGDGCDADADGDSVDDAEDLFPFDARGGLDTDNDGMADEWEALNGLDSADAADANSDVDEDGLTALEEFEGDTDPNQSDLLAQSLTFEAPQFLVIDQAATIKLIYAAADEQDTTGLAFRVHYDKAILGDLIGEYFTAFASGGVRLGGVAFDDIDDFDNDSLTDTYEVFEWSDLSGAWPNTADATVTLLSGTITPNETVTSVRVGLSAISAAAGYVLDLDQLSLSVGRVSLDIDGNGKAEALTDGLLVIRYLFGFRGESLTTGAVASDAQRRTPEDIEAFISALIP